MLLDYLWNLLGLVGMALFGLVTLVGILTDHRRRWPARALDAGVLLSGLVLWFALWFHAQS